MDIIERIPTWIRWPLSVIVFWAVLLFAPMLIRLANFSSERYVLGETTTLTYFIMSIAAQPIAGFLACLAANKIAPKQNLTIVIVNVTVACVVLVSLISYYISTSNWKQIAIFVLTIIALIVACIGLKYEKG